MKPAPHLGGNTQLKLEKNNRYKYLKKEAFLTELSAADTATPPEN